MQRLKSLRKAIKKTQSDVAAYLGISVSAYGNYELGQREPDLDTLNRLATYYDVSVDYLLGRTDDRNIVGVSIFDFDGISPELLDLLQHLNIEQQDKVCTFIRGMLA